MEEKAPRCPSPRDGTDGLCIERRGGGVLVFGRNEEEIKRWDMKPAVARPDLRGRTAAPKVPACLSFACLEE